MIRSRSSWCTGGRPGEAGCVHLSLTRRWCQASRVRGETMRLLRSARGSSRASAVSSALGVPVGVLLALQGLGVALQAEALLSQEVAHRIRADPLAPAGQFLGELAGGLGGPAQRRHRVPADVGLQQGEESRPKGRVQGDDAFAAAAGPADPSQRSLSRVEFPHPERHSGLTDTGGTGHRPDSAVAERPSLRPISRRRCRSSRCGRIASNLAASTARCPSNPLIPDQRTTERKATG